MIHCPLWAFQGKTFLFLGLMFNLCTALSVVNILDAPEDNAVGSVGDDGVADPSLGQEYSAIGCRVRVKNIPLGPDWFLKTQWPSWLKNRREKSEESCEGSKENC